MKLPKNKSNRKAVVLTADKFEDLEVFFPVFRLLEEVWKVDIAAPGISGGAPNGAPVTVRKIKNAQEIAK